VTVLQEIEAERAKQLALGFTAEHDDKEHPDGMLARIAGTVVCHRHDPWGIMTKYWDDRRKQLIIAAALLVAEVERMDRLLPPADQETP
jgi:hypothetical protein